MNIILINSSPRKNGATANMVNMLADELGKYYDVNAEIINVDDLSLAYCVGCQQCYKTGECIFNDDLEQLSHKLANADGVVFASPTYASNVSAQMKTIIDRCHFVMEQLLHNKYALSVAVYENYGGREVINILNDLILFSGGQISGSLLYKKGSSNLRINCKAEKIAQKFYTDIKYGQINFWQKIKHFFIFKFGIKPFVLRNISRYQGVVNIWKEKQRETP